MNTSPITRCRSQETQEYRTQNVPLPSMDATESRSPTTFETTARSLTFIRVKVRHAYVRPVLNKARTARINSTKQALTFYLRRDLSWNRTFGCS